MSKHLQVLHLHTLRYYQVPRYAVAMASSLLHSALVAILCASCHPLFGQTQSTPEPLPAGPAPAPLVLPKSTGIVPLFSSKPQDVPPPAPLPTDEEGYCSTPTATAYRTNKPVSAEGRKAAELYMWTVKKQIWTNWKPPREINDPWLKGAVVRIKFEILPDGSLNDPTIMMSSGRASYDRRALDSIRQSAPFGPPPANGPVPFRVCYRFSYNMNRDNQDTMPVDVFAKKPAQP